MSVRGSLSLLGTGAATGVPVIACDCEVCVSHHPRNKRLRASALLEVNGKVLLIDAGPDFREQALKKSIHHLDGLLLTHTHYDHIAGIDELRIYYYRTGHPLPCLLSQASYDDMRQRYDYMFRPKMHGESISAQFVFQVLPGNHGDFVFEGVPLRFFSYEQGKMPVNGFRFGDLAYVSDVGNHEEKIFDELRGVRRLVLSALRFEESLTHLSVGQAIDFAEKAGVEQCWLTHLGHELDYDKTTAQLPESVRLAYDGLCLPLTL